MLSKAHGGSGRSCSLLEPRFLFNRPSVTRRHGNALVTPESDGMSAVRGARPISPKQTPLVGRASRPSTLLSPGPRGGCVNFS
jgi:hypothetical protein